ncbi:type II secretion system protein [Phycisphaerales bacterium AB-hyl4]|uniref:Type II secretion system protein n=1 Tax=Natronomicrosphaera hydrolytica TaxID=3242702 RepID=A0ABV4U4A9_9BACT
MRRKRTHTREHHTSAFTLIELLVTITVIVLLISIVLPALGNARGSARAVLCLNHQRQLATTVMMYVDDFRGALPRPTIGTDVVGMSTAQQQQAVWYNAVDAYYGKATPTSASERHHEAWKHDPVWASFDEAKRANNRTIKMNDYLKGNNDNDEPPHFTYEQAIRRPTLMVLFVDGQSADVHPNASNDTHFGATPGRVALRHADGANVTFVDGHGRHVRQAIRDDLVVPGWFLPTDVRQELLWRVADQ